MMVNFADFKENARIEKDGKYKFTIDKAELTCNSKGNPQVIFQLVSDEGTIRLYIQLQQNLLWKYNKLIGAALNLKKGQKFEYDPETIHNQLIGKQFIGEVKSREYEKENKIEQDGLFITQTVTKIAYDVAEFYPVDTDID